MRPVTQAVRGLAYAGWLMLAGPTSAASAPACGVYVVDVRAGTYRDGAIRAYDFVDGYALRLQWSDVEPSPGNYDFRAIDHVLGRLRPLGQKLSLTLLGEEPAWLTAAAAARHSYVDNNPNHDTYGQTIVRPVPWDEFALQRLEALAAALASHEVESGTGRQPLGRAPELAALDLSLPGWGSIRELFFELTQIPGYDRETLWRSVSRALHAQTDHFPNTSVRVGFWPVSDRVVSPALWEDLRQRILTEFDGLRNPRVGFFQENLSAGLAGDGRLAFAPVPEYASPLYLSRFQTFIQFQALTSWVRPFTGADKVKGGDPPSAMRWARDTYGTRYFEIYAPDLDAALAQEPGWLPGLRELHVSLCAP